jgi:hypothetical protein
MRTVVDARASGEPRLLPADRGCDALMVLLVRWAGSAGVGVVRVPSVEEEDRATCIGAAR